LVGGKTRNRSEQDGETELQRAPATGRQDKDVSTQ
jgi:hypothetical protein